MITSGIEFQCVYETDNEGYLTRYPSCLYNLMRKTAREFCNVMATNEIRFHIGEGKVVLKVWAEHSSIENMSASIFFGDHFGRSFKLNEGLNTIEMEFPNLLKNLDDKNYGSSFSNRVVRVFLPDCKLKFISIEGDYCLPETSEVPLKNIIAYGTSITQGIGASHGHLGYAKILANSMGYDLRNYGIGSSAFIEREVVDYISSQETADMYLFELSLNMLNQGVPKDIFKERVRYLLDTIGKKGKPIVIISPFKYFYSLGFKNENPALNIVSNIEEYEQALFELKDELNNSNITFVKGTSISSISGLSSDLIHPSDMGMVEIAQNLNEIITNIKGL